MGLANKVRRVTQGRTVPLLLGMVGGVAAVVIALVASLGKAPGNAIVTRPELVELAGALAREAVRPSDARMSLAIPYAVSPEMVKMETGEVSPAVLLAAAGLERQVRSDSSGRGAAALGLAFLAARDWERAISSLEASAQKDGSEADVWIDLAAAYLGRARAGGVPEYWAKGLAAANRARRLQPLRPEGHFNRAVALEGLDLTHLAIDAWRDCERREPNSPWGSEGDQRARLLATQFQQAADRTSAVVNNQSLRERIEDIVLPRWGTASLAGDASAASERLKEAAALAERLAQGGGDGMPSDGIRRIIEALRLNDAASIEALARGHQLYGEARTAYLADRQRHAVGVMSRASRSFRLVGSPYALWEKVFEAIALRTEGKPRSSLAALSVVDVAALPRDYSYLRSRHDWARGVALDELGRFDVGAQALSRAVEGFRASKEPGNVARTLAILAEAQWSLGDHGLAWRYVAEALRDVAKGSDNSHNYHLAVAAKLALSAGLPEAAIEFDNARVGAARTPRSTVEALQRRARTFALLGNTPAAVSDLDQAITSVGLLADPALRERNVADLNIARAEVFSVSDPAAATVAANAALEYVRRGDPAFALGKLLVLRGKARESLGDLDGARADLETAVDVFENKRQGLSSASDRLRAFEYERPAFKQLIRLEAVTRASPSEALRVAERSRAGGWVLPRPGDSSYVDPSTAHRALDADVGVVLYEVLEDRVLVWVLTGDTVAHFSRPVGLVELTRQVTEIEKAIQRGATLAGLKPTSDVLVEALVSPALALIGSRSHVVFVPDGPMYSLPFGALPVYGNQPLILRIAVTVAPSLTMFLRASAKLESAVLDEVLAVGAGHDPAQTGLVPLPFADREASAIGALYPQRRVLLGAQATSQGLFAGDSPVWHFAGHTVVNREFPLLSRLFLAPEPGGSGVLLASEMLAHRFRRARVVVLATCEAGAGVSVDGEGFISVARAFLASGVPAVVASLWPVADNNLGFFVQFHRELRARRDVSAALRFAQLAHLHQAGISSPVRVWGGVVALGGSAIVEKGK